MSRKKRNNTRIQFGVSTSATLQFNNTNHNNTKNNEIVIVDQWDNDDTSSDSGQSEFDEEYERNRPPIRPIDRSRVRPVKIPITTTTTEIELSMKQESDNEFNNNNNDIETITDMTLPRMSKLQRKRLHARQRKLEHLQKLNETSTTTTEIELSIKQESDNEFNNNNDIETNTDITPPRMSKSERKRLRAWQRKLEHFQKLNKKLTTTTEIELSIKQESDNEFNNNIETNKGDEILPRISKSKRKKLRARQRKLEYLQKLDETTTATTEIELSMKQESSNEILIEQPIGGTNIRRKQRDKRGRRARNKARKPNETDRPSTYAEILKKEFVQVEAVITAIENANWRIHYDHFPVLIDTIDNYNNDGVINMKKYDRNKNKKEQEHVSCTQLFDCRNETDNQQNIGIVERGTPIQTPEYF